MLEPIVVGVDGREGGRDALALAARLAEMSGASLVAVRNLPFNYYASRSGSPPFAKLSQEDARAEIAEEVASAGLAARVRVLGDSSPARALHRVAEEEGAGPSSSDRRVAASPGVSSPATTRSVRSTRRHVRSRSRRSGSPGASGRP